MRSAALPTWLVLFTACSTPPLPAAPAGPPAPAGSASAALPEPPARAPVEATSTRPPPRAAPSDEGAPPDPPMAVRWTFHLPPVGGQPGTTQRLALLESGDATWESAHGGRDGDVDEELSPSRAASSEVERCRGHLGPTRHRRLVVAARRAMESGCAKAGSTDRLGRPADAGATTLAVTWAGEIKSCEVGRSGGTYAAFEELRADAVAAICARR